MEKYFVDITDQAKKQLAEILKSGDKASIKKLQQIFIELSIHPASGVGKPEKLKFEFSGYWSRQINKKDRLVYRIDEEIITVFVISAKGHYHDK
ncbi:Txe/YoeB family addiction module toxin [Pedobacter riviphilus]|uniref:Putative mRNA interferase YoeB n=1 Tax=Pedobacter riviphilus TaxID=2766984 RepID=A0ABX6TJ15_9SPHI|nr:MULTISPECIES: Txe/YoeB family addiction module toxin [Pedobacter]NII85169.1 toxin YoeB [Pedobacter sp. SG908]NMN37923.1 toxin YoeB [Pedobacter sp. SG918]QNR84925.1 Txe/YoeB family addiction module toxin [Pedobacter riviphilus]